jgi:hypothetical protein
MSVEDNYDWVLFAWAIDFLRCVEEMPVWRKRLIRIILGKYAAREYIGMREHLDKQQHNQTQWGYGLEGCGYHKEKWSWLK